MSPISSPAFRLTALAVLLGTTALAAPSFAATASAKSSSTVVAANSSDTSGAAMSAKGHMMSPEKMKAEVEARISTLHDKLGITPDQESQWQPVAQAMRDNETTISGLIQERHQNAKTMSAVEDLESYQSIAQAHADGLKNVISAFQTLYDSMSDDQKAKADKVFGTFEGHPDRMHKISK